VSGKGRDEMGVAGGASQVQILGPWSRPKLRKGDSGLERAEGKLFRPDTWRNVLVLWQLYSSKKTMAQKPFGSCEEVSNLASSAVRT
jgi:hypothetical protein